MDNTFLERRRDQLLDRPPTNFACPQCGNLMHRSLGGDFEPMLICLDCFYWEDNNGNSFGKTEGSGSATSDPSSIVSVSDTAITQDPK